LTTAPRHLHPSCPSTYPSEEIKIKNLRIAKRYTGSSDLSKRAKQNQQLRSETEPDCRIASQQMHSGKRLGRTNSRFLRLRQALALPIYALSLIPDFASVALGRLAAVVAGDWPE
jgi:hypothetical protein